MIRPSLERASSSIHARAWVQARPTIAFSAPEGHRNSRADYMISAQDSQHATKPTKEQPTPGRRAQSAARGIPAGLADAGLVALFLALTFLLGIFPLKDVDFYWHLRTGDLIRQTGEIPRVDIYTFTREGTPWIDLHWIYQVGISWLYEHGG